MYVDRKKQQIPVSGRHPNIVTVYRVDTVSVAGLEPNTGLIILGKAL